MYGTRHSATSSGKKFGEMSSRKPTQRTQSRPVHSKLREKRTMGTRVLASRSSKSSFKRF